MRDFKYAIWPLPGEIIWWFWTTGFGGPYRSHGSVWAAYTLLQSIHCVPMPIVPMEWMGLYKTCMALNFI